MSRLENCKFSFAGILPCKSTLPSSDKTRFGEAGAGGELQLPSMRHGVGFHGADGLSIQHQLSDLQMSIDDWLVQSARSLRR